MSPPTISDAIGNDHKIIDSYADKIRTSTTLDDKTKWRNQFTWALARHAISEELTVYPAMEKHMGQEGIELTDVDRQQHQAVSSQPSCRLSHKLTLCRSKKTYISFKPCHPPTHNSFPTLMFF